MKLAAFFFLTLTLPAFVMGQDERVRGAVKTPNGILIIWNEPSNNFTLHVKGRTVERVPNKNIAFLINGKFLQIVTAFKNDFLNDAQKKARLDDAAILAAHLAWESAYLEKTVGEKLAITSQPATLPNNKAGLLWSFLTPEKHRDQVERQVFLTLVKGDSVLVLNGAVTETVDENAVRSFLLETAATLAVRDKPLTQEEAIDLASKIN